MTDALREAHTALIDIQSYVHANVAPGATLDRLVKDIVEIGRALAAQPVAQPLPHPGSPEVSALLDSILHEYGWPANSKNAARAGWTAAMRFLGAGAQPVGLPRPDSFSAEEVTMLTGYLTEHTAKAVQRPVGRDRADAERYRYLRDRADPDSGVGVFVSQYGLTNDWGKELRPHLAGAELDSIIDAETQRPSHTGGEPVRAATPHDLNLAIEQVLRCWHSTPDKISGAIANLSMAYLEPPAATKEPKP